MLSWKASEHRKSELQTKWDWSHFSKVDVSDLTKMMLQCYTEALLALERSMLK